MLTFKNKHFKIVYFVKESSMSNTWTIAWLTSINIIIIFKRNACLISFYD